MRLADFILANREPIIAEWEVFARSMAAGANMTTLALRDHADEILLATARDMMSAQSPDQQSLKSKGLHAHDDASLNGASDLHATGRLGSGFNLLEVVSEYRALRASVLQLWRESLPDAHERYVDDLTRYNESIDQSLCKAVASYTKRVDQSRDMFLAILSHDLRNPLNSIAVSAHLLPQLSPLDAESINCTAQITSSASVMARMINDLLDYTRTRLGAGMPVKPVPMDLAILGKELYNEFQTAHPTRQIRFHTDGDLNGDWDADRLRQAISNLMGNAIQHGAEDVPVVLTLRGENAAVFIKVQNGGSPISPGELPHIFEPLIRGSSAGTAKKNRPGSIGMGLYIAREIAKSHGGSIEVTSTEETGTAFTIRLPRHADIYTGQPILDEQHLAKI
jgi:signal transduction histidine kinase